MLRGSCRILINKLFEAGKIDEKRKYECLEFIMRDRAHQDIRNLIAMILLPKKLHKNDKSQAAYLRAAVSRVSCQNKLSICISDCKSNCIGKLWRFDAGTHLLSTFPRRQVVGTWTFIGTYWRSNCYQLQEVPGTKAMMSMICRL